MATRYAVASGNWSAASTWDGTTTIPTTGDTVVANAFTVTIDQTLTVTEIRTLASGSGGSGGGFTVSGAYTINANVLAGTTTCLTCTNTSGTTVTVNGNITGSAATGSVHAVLLSGTGTLTITGNVLAGGATGSGMGISITAAGTVTVTGSVTGGTGANAFGIGMTAAATVTITGNVLGGTNATANGVSQTSGASAVTVVGNVTGAGGLGLSNASAGSTTTVTGNVTGGATSTGITSTSTGTILITGNVTGGSAGSAYGVNNSATGALAINGDITAGTAFACSGVSATNSAGSPFHHEGNLIGVATGAQAGTTAVAARVMAVYSIATRKHGWPEAQGAMPGNPTGYSGALTYLYGVSNAGSQSGQAAVADVRKSTVYGPTSNLTGLAYIPGASSVLAGVNVDQTVGTATLAAADIRAALGMASANLDTQIAAVQADTDNLQTRLPSALTANGNIKASLVEILTTAVTESVGGYLAAAYKKLLDVAVPVFTVASVNQTGDNYARLGAPAGASASADIAAVKAVLPAALVSGRIDASVGAMAAAVVTAAAIATDAIGAAELAADAASEIATAVRTELAVELARVDAAITTRTKPADTQARVTLVDTTTTLTNAPSDSSGVTTLLSRLSALRAGYLDNLSAGAVALEASLQGLITTVGVAGAGLTAADDAVIAAIAALNNLSLANVRTAVGLASANLDTQLAAIAVYIDTEVAAILAKVNNLPSDPADASDIAALFSAIAASLAALSIPTTAQIADKLLGRNLAGGSDGVRTVQDALRFSRNKVTIVPINATSGTLTVYAEDDTTPAWTGVVTRASADALSAVDPA